MEVTQMPRCAPLFMCVGGFCRVPSPHRVSLRTELAVSREKGLFSEELSASRETLKNGSSESPKKDPCCRVTQWNSPRILQRVCRETLLWELALCCDRRINVAALSSLRNAHILSFLPPPLLCRCCWPVAGRALSTWPALIMLIMLKSIPPW